MPDSAPPVTIHDWPRVGGFWHSFHLIWVGEMYRQLNEGVLPAGYYAEAEPQGGFSVGGGGDGPGGEGDPPGGSRFEGDVVTLRSAGAAESAGTALAERPPKVRVEMPFVAAPPGARRVVVRRGRDDRTVALIELASPGNRDGRAKVRAFCDKIESAVLGGLHVLLIDLFPPNRLVPAGLHGAVAERFGVDYDPPPGEPLTCAAYRSAGEATTSFVEPLAVGAAVPTMPLFLTPDRYVDLPLADSYAAAFRPTPRRYREMLAAPGRPAGAAAG